MTKIMKRILSVVILLAIVLLIASPKLLAQEWRKSKEGLALFNGQRYVAEITCENGSSEVWFFPQTIRIKGLVYAKKDEVDVTLFSLNGISLNAMTGISGEQIIYELFKHDVIVDIYNNVRQEKETIVLSSESFNKTWHLISECTEWLQPAEKTWERLNSPEEGNKK